MGEGRDYFPLQPFFGINGSWLHILFSGKPRRTRGAREDCMKATGIVRRIDELGRVVIPKEIRRTLRLKDGDPLEIFTDRDELMLKKYSPIATLEKFSESTTKSLSDLSGYLAVICDTDEILYASGEGRKDFAGKQITEKLEQIMKDRRSYIANLAEGGRHCPARRKQLSGHGTDHRPPSSWGEIAWVPFPCSRPRKGSEWRATRSICAASRLISSLISSTKSRFVAFGSSRKRYRSAE